MTKNLKLFKHFKRILNILTCFKKNIAWILQQVYKFSKDFGLYFKNTKNFYFVSFNMRDYKLIHKIHS